jgi:hypothetical protein
MAKIIKYAGAYLMWMVDLGLSFWLFLMSRTVFLGLFALSYKGGNLVYAQRVDFADKVFTILLGLGWLVFMIIVEAYFRAGASRADLLKRFANITAPVVLGIFGVDLILLWLQGVGGGGWLRQSVLAAELGIGIVLLMLARFQPEPKSI